MDIGILKYSGKKDEDGKEAFVICHDCEVLFDARQLLRSDNYSLHCYLSVVESISSLESSQVVCEHAYSFTFANSISRLLYHQWYICPPICMGKALGK